MSDLERWSQTVSRELSRHAAAIAEIQKRVDLRRSTPVSNADDRFVEDMLQRQHHYANTIILLGYGGFFALWASVHQAMPRWLFGLCGLTIGVSIALFVAWEMFKMRVLAKAAREALFPDKHGQRMSPTAARQHVVQAAGAADAKYHAMIFWTSTVTGFAAGITVLVFFVWHMTFRA